MPSREQQKEILAVGLLALALFMLLSLVPPSVFGSRGVSWFPSGNLMGQVGATLRTLLSVSVGAAAVVLPVLLVLAAAWVGEWMSTERSGRWALLVTGLGLLVPIALHVAAPGSAGTGWLGAFLGAPLESAMGSLGSYLVLAALTVILSVLTLGWNPLRPAGRGIAQGGGLVGRGAVGAGGWTRRKVSAWWERRAERKAELAKVQYETPEDHADEIWDDGERKAGEDVEEPSTGLAQEEEGSAVDGGPRPADPAKPAELAEPSDVDPELESGAFPEPQDEAWGEDPSTSTPLAAGQGDAEETNPVPLPSLDHLATPEGKDLEGMERELDRSGEVLIEKLRSFGVEGHIGGRTSGPVVTQFEVVPAPGVKVNKIANLDADLALAMKARSIRIVAPIPGKGAVGVEIPNPTAEVVFLREILESGPFQRSKAQLPLGLGKDLTGKPYVSDLVKMPHVLIAGATGSGKSVCLNTIITSLVYRHTPETLRLLLVDPKMVELSTYRDLPHLRHPVVTDPREAAGVLKWAVLEMERRYSLLSENGVRSIAEFNERLKEGKTLRRTVPKGPEGDPDRWVYSDGVLPYIVVVIDELADLMMTVQQEVERPLTGLAQKARAIGIHLIVATQRPSVNVITGLIKANFPCRIAFRVASKTDSRTILDQNGADALLGNGDMLFLPPGTSEPVRIQGAFMSTGDTDRLTGWYREVADQIEAAQDSAQDHVVDEVDILDVVRAVEAEEASSGPEGGDDGSSERDELFRDAAEVCLQHQQGSTSLLQRKLRIGYGRAARIVDQLHDAGILGPPEGSKARDVLIIYDDLDAYTAPKF